MNLITKHPFARLTHFLINRRQHLLLNAQVGHSVDKFYHAHLLEGPLDILLSYGSLLYYVLEGEILPLVGTDIVHQSLRPPGQIRFPAQIGQWPLRSAHLILDDAQLVAEGDQELAIALALVERQCQNAGEVIIGFFGLREVTRDVILVVLYFAQDVEQEYAHVPLQILVVQEQLRQEA